MGLSTTALPRYVQLRRSGYYFRYAVPATVRHLVGRGELKVSLRTRSKRTAQHRAAKLASLLYEVFHSMTPSDLTPERIRELVQRELSAWMAFHEERELDDPVWTQEQADRLARAHDIAAAASKQTLATNDYGAFHERAIALLAAQGLETSLETPDPATHRLVKRVAREFATAQVAFFEALAKRHRGDVESPYAPSLITTAPLDTERSPEAPNLSTLWEMYSREKVTQRKWNQATLDGNNATFAEFLQIVGEIPVTEVTRDTMNDYLGKLQQLPKGSLVKYKGKDASDLLKQDIPKSDLRSSRTVSEALTRIKGFLRWCVKSSEISANPADFVSIQSHSKPRDPFSQDDLRKLFNSPEYREGNHSKSWQFWTPLLALYTGARQNEIAQLLLKDVITIDGVHAFDITDEEEGASVKSKAGFRKVPIHAALLDIGFMDYVSALRTAGEERLFPDLTRGARRWGQSVSTWFNREDARASGYMLKCGVNKLGGRKVFHSFRHTVITRLLRAEVPVDKVQFLVGHERSLMGATKSYDHLNFEDSVGVIERLDFGLDHSSIKGHWKKYT